MSQGTVVVMPAGANALVPHDMDQAIRLAQAMASAKMVPKHLQGDTGTCLMVVEQAMRWQMSPFAVAQCTSSIGGRLMFEGKLVAAAVESSGAIEGGFDYKFDGEGDARKVTVSAKRRGETSPRQMTIHLKDVRTGNEWWKKQPDQMLVYSGTRNWARRWTPAVILGVYAPEEFDRQSGTVKDDFSGTTIDAKAEEPAQTRREQINEATPLEPEAPRPQKLTWSQLLESFELAIRDATSADEITHLLQSPQMTEAKHHVGKARPEYQARMDTLMVLADERLAAFEADAVEAELPEEATTPA